MDTELTFIATAVDLLIIALLVYVLVILCRQFQKARRHHYFKSIVLMMSGVGVILLYLLVDVAVMQALPLWFSPADVDALKTEIHLNWDWIVILIGISTVSLGINYLLHFSNPSVVETLGQQLEWQQQAEMEIKAAKQELESQFGKLSSELQESEYKARKAYEITEITLQNMEQGIIMLNAEGEVLIYNERFLEFSKISREEAGKCRTFEDLLEHANVAISAEVKARAIKLAREGGDISYETVFEDGTIFDIRQRSIPGGGVVRTYTDVTRYKTIEAELREAISNLETATDIMRTTLENMGQGILMVDAKGEIVTYNDKVLEYLGKDREAAKSARSLREYFRVGKTTEADVERAMQFAASKERVTYELTTLDGKVLEVQQNPLADGGFVRTYTNISGHKKIENDLRLAKEQADTSNRAKANFLATMSHEIRTPMNGIIGMVDLLALHGLNEEQFHLVRTIRDSGYALLTIINDILDLSKIDAGKLDLEMIEMSITETVEGAAETLATNAAQKDIRLVTFIDPVLTDSVVSDPIRLRQILFNLISNAIKFSASGDEVLILVEPATATVSADKNGGKDKDENEDEKARGTREMPVRFTITDSGIGISEQAQLSLFQAFSQAEASTTRKYGGTGLGLSICRRLTEMMGGNISLKSREGEGSSFFVDLTFRTSIKTEAQQEKPLAGLRVLVVGGSEKQGHAAVSYITDAGADAEFEEDPEKALALYQAGTANKPAYDLTVLFDGLGEALERTLYEKVAKAKGKISPRLVKISGFRAKNDTLKLGNGNITRIEGNPLLRWKLIKAVAIAAGRASPFVNEDELGQARLGDIDQPSMKEALVQGGLILVAEDNIINQDLIRRQLKQLGYQCEIAGDGKEALTMWREKNYALILSDCHMPEMDGYQLTQTIRSDEEEEGKQRTPIVAITANALTGEAERCLSVGMDGYLVKPLKLKKLQLTLENMLGSKTTPDTQDISANKVSEKSAHTESDLVIDERALKDEFGDDPDVFKEILLEFLAPAEVELGKLKKAMETRSLEQVEAASHKMKSACRMIGAIRLAVLYEVLENAGRNGHWEQLDKQAPRLDELMAELRNYIDAL